MLQIVGQLSKRRGQERKRARERCASETATQRGVMLAKHHQQRTDMYAFFSERRVACPSYYCEVSRVSTGVIIDVRKLMTSTDTHNLDKYLPVYTMSYKSLNPYFPHY